jgi:hypothetical protein
MRINAITDVLLSNLHKAEETFYSSDRSIEDYFLACEELRVTIQQMAQNWHGYGRAIDGVMFRLENNAFFYRGHDEALIELIKTVPFSLKLAVTKFGKDPDSKLMISALVESFCKQALIIDDMREEDFNRLFQNLIEMKMPRECIMILEHLVSLNDGKHDELIASLIYSSAASSVFNAANYTEIKAWLAKNSAMLMSQPWAERLSKMAKMRTSLAIYEHGMQEIGVACMKACACQSTDDDLIRREKLAGIAVTQKEILMDGLYPSITALLPYALWNGDKSFRIEWLYGRKVDSKTLTNALVVAQKYGPIEPAIYHQAISNSLNSQRDISNFFEVMHDHVLPTENLDPGIVQQGLSLLLNHHRHDFRALKNIANRCSAINIKPSIGHIQDIIDVTFCESIREANNIAIFLCELKKPICDMISRDILLEKVSETVRKISEPLRQKVVAAINSELVEQIPLLHRAKLINDLSL